MYKKLLLTLISFPIMHYSIAMEEERTLTLINKSRCRIECTLPNGQCIYLEPQNEYFAERTVSYPESGLMHFKEDNYYARRPKLGSYSTAIHITKATQTVKIRLSHDGYECCWPFFRRYWLDVQTEENHSVQFIADGDPSD